jgi:hypothetical protein
MDGGNWQQSGIAIVLLLISSVDPRNAPFLWWCHPRSCSCRIGVGDAIPVTAAALSCREASPRFA